MNAMSMEMENLMLQRFKVIADYPNSKFEIGAILTPIRKETNYYEDVKSGEMAFHPEKFPNIFQPLSWWMDRSLKTEMPKFVKVVTEHSSLFKNDIYEVDYWGCQDGEVFCELFDGKTPKGLWSYPAKCFDPCTPQDYRDFIAKPKK